MFSKKVPNKRVAIIAVVAALVSYFACYTALRQPGDGSTEIYYPTELDFYKLKTGMTENEVKAILGPPHKIVTWESRIRASNWPAKPGEKLFLYKAAKKEKDGFEGCHVEIGANGHVRGFGWGFGQEKNVFERILEWLKSNVS